MPSYYAVVVHLKPFCIVCMYLGDNATIVNPIIKNLRKTFFAYVIEETEDARVIWEIKGKMRKLVLEASEEDWIHSDCSQRKEVEKEIESWTSRR